MKIRARFWWDRVRTSFWFIPAVMAVGAAILFLFTVDIDYRISSDALQGAWWLYGGGHEGARAVLSVVASSMITVAGVVFSIMMVVLSLAAQQYGPRLLRNFMRDRITQVVLGVFVATFLYCLLVLRTIRGENHQPFVPQISVTVGVALSLISLGLLIYFIHHVSISIHIGQITTRVQEELLLAIDSIFPEMLGNSEVDVPGEPKETATWPDFDRVGVRVLAEESGYLEAVDEQKLLEVAKRDDVVVRMDVQPGDFVLAKQAVMMVAPRDRVTDDTVADLNGTLLMGAQRTPVQDVAFAIERQADIAIRALSPGINDPLTAIDCVERLTDALDRLAARRIPSSYRYDENGNMRIVATTISFQQLLASSIGAVRQYATVSPMVTMKITDNLGRLADRVRRQTDLQALQEQLDAIASCTFDTLSTHDREQIRRHVDRARAVFEVAAPKA
jgi:uncharacterized membrane protein